MRIFVLFLLCSSFWSSCKMRGNESRTRAAEDEVNPCEGIYDSQQQGDCMAVFEAIIRGDTARAFGEFSSEPYEKAFGQPLTLSNAGKCLAKVGDKVVTTACMELEAGHKWHFAKLEVRYTWGGVEQFDHVFHAISRESMRKWLVNDHSKTTSPKLECLDYYDIDAGGKGKQYVVRKLKLSPCAESKLMFVTAPNDIAGDDNQPDPRAPLANRWARVIGIDLAQPKFAALKTSMAHYRPYLYQPCEQGCTGAFPEGEPGEVQQKRLDLGEFKAVDGTWPLVNSTFDFETPQKVDALLQLTTAAHMAHFNSPDYHNGQSAASVFDEHMLIGGCGPHRYDGEASCFEGAVPLVTYKKLYDATTESVRGNVVQLRTLADSCVLWNGSEVNCVSTRGIDKPDGDDASQFRLTPVANPMQNSETFVQLQRVQNEGTASLICYDLITKTSGPCCAKDQADTCGKRASYLLSGQSLIYRDPTTNTDNKMNLHFCVSSSSTKQNIAHDCVDYVDPKWKKYSNIANIIQVIPILGSIPAYVLMGMICNSGEKTISKEACTNLIMGVTIDIAVLPLDIFGMVGTGAEVIEQLVANKVVKANSSLVIDFATDPALSAFAYMAARRVYRQIESTVAKEGLQAAAKNMTGPLTTAIINRAVKNGIKGASVTGAYDQKLMPRIIKNAGDAVQAVL